MKSIHWASEFSALALRYGERVAVVEIGGTTTYADVFAKAAGIGHALIAAGIGPGDAVATLFRNSAEAVAATFGVMMAGAVEVPINPALSPDECAHCLAVAHVRLVITSAILAEGVGADGPPILSVESVKQAACNPATFPRVEADAPARIVFTSGTTGRPKGAVHSQIGRWTANVLLRANLPFRPAPTAIFS